ncbi:hypothetical protein C2845_PM03G07370 [Panicum miliaceum]|uniref:DUF1618 domain-containing protein n=1 Tax=Panicum miliaceum TaxID=4540 RepID=A0A3L6TG33_PANMI|nr:hypothetical protein C2845_PM03G07370 [Panicum miliaceum]
MATGGGGWVLFNPRVITRGFEHHAPKTAACLTSNGLGVRVSLRLAAPPAASNIQVSTDDRLYRGAAVVVAADGDLLRIHMVFAVKSESPSYFPHGFFVHRAHPECPSLLLIPLPPIPDNWEWWVGCCGRRSAVVRGRGGGEFLAVDLQRRSATVKQELDNELVTELLRSGCCTITTWTLSSAPAAATRWEEEHTLRLANLWASWEYQRSPLPRCTPEFPVFDGSEAHVLHFVLHAGVLRLLGGTTITVKLHLGELAPPRRHGGAPCRRPPPLGRLRWPPPPLAIVRAVAAARG